MKDNVIWQPCGPFKTLTPFGVQADGLLTKVYVYGQLIACYILRLQRWPPMVSPLLIGQLCVNATSSAGALGDGYLSLEYLHKFHKIAGELLWPWFELVRLSGDGPLVDVSRTDPLRNRIELCLSTFSNTTVSIPQRVLE